MNEKPVQRAFSETSRETKRTLGEEVSAPLCLSCYSSSFAVLRKADCGNTLITGSPKRYMFSCEEPYRFSCKSFSLAFPLQDTTEVKSAGFMRMLVTSFRPSEPSLDRTIKGLAEFNERVLGTPAS